jgi:hypothetical protein
LTEIVTVSRRSKLRGIRVPVEVEAVLTWEAEQRNVSFNALVGSILKKYAEYDRFVEKFGATTLTHETLQRLLESLDDKAITRLASELGESVPKQIVLFWFKDLTVENFFKFLSISSVYKRMMMYDFELRGTSCRVAMRHEYGKKWTLFLRHYFEGAVKSILGLNPITSVEDESMVLRFNLRPKMGVEEARVIFEQIPQPSYS